MRPVLGAPAFDTLRAKKMDALYVAINELLNANRLRIVTSAQAAKLPTILGTRDWAGSGGLRSYGPNFPALFARAGRQFEHCKSDRDHTSRDARREGRHSDRKTIRFGGRYWHETDMPPLSLHVTRVTKLTRPLTSTRRGMSSHRT